eukprot:TRINITY_DN12808_c0_g4_i1.p1 TRINITY_DN12808_c0_g4~~TRINITY_DN12808_c0_g4_i1.p1  ORF type:complete len:815 (+),score=118.21 TRINITY_DN12808_c0_g4_i1:258-2447(+)
MPPGASSNLGGFPTGNSAIVDDECQSPQASQLRRAKAMRQRSGGINAAVGGQVQEYTDTTERRRSSSPPPYQQQQASIPMQHQAMNQAELDALSTPMPGDVSPGGPGPPTRQSNMYYGGGLVDEPSSPQAQQLFRAKRYSRSTSPNSGCSGGDTYAYADDTDPTSRWTTGPPFGGGGIALAPQREAMEEEQCGPSQFELDAMTRNSQVQSSCYRAPCGASGGWVGSPAANTYLGSRNGGMVGPPMYNNTAPCGAQRWEASGCGGRQLVGGLGQAELDNISHTFAGGAGEEAWNDGNMSPQASQLRRAKRLTPSRRQHEADGHACGLAGTEGVVGCGGDVEEPFSPQASQILRAKRLAARDHQQQQQHQQQEQSRQLQREHRLQMLMQLQSHSPSRTLAISASWWRPYVRSGVTQPTGQPGDAAVTTPRVAFAEMPPVASGHPLWNGSLVPIACLCEAVAVVPTIQLELKLAADPWALLLRSMIAVVRLFPVFVYVTSSVTRWIGPNDERNATTYTWGRLFDCGSTFATAVLCPEVRWGVAITLDMWYLLSTPLNKDLHDPILIMVLVGNAMLCFGDTVMLIIMLAAKNDENPEADCVDLDGVRPRAFTYDEEEAEKFDPTCIICLGDFRQGDDIEQLPCNHIFHAECIGKWLAKSRYCPLRCPQVVLPHPHTQAPLQVVTDGPGAVPATTETESHVTQGVPRPAVADAEGSSADTGDSSVEDALVVESP